MHRDFQAVTSPINQMLCQIAGATELRIGSTLSVDAEDYTISFTYANGKHYNSPLKLSPFLTYELRWKRLVEIAELAAKEMNPSQQPRILCLCRCPLDEHPLRADGVSREGCAKLGPDGRRHCYGFVGDTDEIDA